MAMCVMAVVGEAPCQCFSPGENQITSPGRISSIGSPHRCTRPAPNTTIKVCPRGCVCHAVRAPGSNVTLAPAARAGSGGLKQRIDPHGPGEPVGWALARGLRTGAFDVHGRNRNGRYGAAVAGIIVKG